METLIIVLLVAYNVWLVTYLLLERQGKKEKPEKSVVQESKPISSSNDIIGKSKFKVRKIEKPMPLTAKLTPLDAKEEKGEDIPNLPTTFVDETENKPSARMLDNKIDDAFSDARMEELPSEYNDEDDYDGTPNDGYATGHSFDEIKKSVATVNNPDATPDEKHKAGEVFSEMTGSELYARLTKNRNEWESKIKGLIDGYLYKTKNNDSISSRSKPKSKRKEFKMPTSLEEFNIRDYV